MPFRTGHFHGMTAHARGAIRLHPEARVLVDIGALHARAVVMDGRSQVLGCRMTSQCASGSGQFLENICRYLGITIDEIGPLSLEADAPEACSSICAVLAETDVINMVSRGISTPNIIAGIHQSMAGRYLKLLTSLNASGTVLVTGGLAADVGLLAAKGLALAPGARVVDCELTDAAAVTFAVDAVVAESGRLDVVVHCAGITRDGVSWKLSDEDWSDVLRCNLDSAYWLLRAATPHLRHAGGGSVVLVGSISLLAFFQREGFRPSGRVCLELPVA